MLALRPEVFSVAVTLRIPLTSTSKTTSRTASPARCTDVSGFETGEKGGDQRTMGGIGASVNSPREVLSVKTISMNWRERERYSRKYHHRKLVLPEKPGTGQSARRISQIRNEGEGVSSTCWLSATFLVLLVSKATMEVI